MSHISFKLFFFNEVWVRTSLPRTFLSILVDLRSVVVRMVSILPLIFCAPCLVSRLLRPILHTRSIIGFIVTFKFHSIFSSLARSRYWAIFLISFIFPLWLAETAKSSRWQVFFKTKSGFLSGIRWSVCISLSPREFCASQFLRRILVYAYSICQQVLISCIILSGLTLPASRGDSYIPLV